MKTLAAIFACMLLFGCLGGFGLKGAGDGALNSSASAENCREVSYEEKHCSEAGYNFSYSPLKIDSPYMLGDTCVGGATLTVKNLEKVGGTFKVTFMFETPIEGKTAKVVEKEIGAKSSADFGEKAQFRCGQEYSVDFRVAPPTKQACRMVNGTREECTGAKAP